MAEFIGFMRGNMMWRCIFATIIINKILIFPSVSAEKKAWVTVESCRILTEHIPADDVSYKGGVDVRGKPVKPADLSPAPYLRPQDGVSFQLILDVAEENRAAGNPQRQLSGRPGQRGDMYMGQVVVRDGKVTLDGRPLGGANRKALYVLCQKNNKKKNNKNK